LEPGRVAAQHGAVEGTFCDTGMQLDRIVLSYVSVSDVLYFMNTFIRPSMDNQQTDRQTDIYR